MATFTTAAVIPNSRTPYSVVIRVANDGHLDDPPYPMPRATLLASLLEGPLKALLACTVDWTDLNFAPNEAKAGYVRITRIEGGLNATLQPPDMAMILYFIADALVFSIGYGGEGMSACDLLVELRMVHSTDR
jgi:hypothetical protein